MNVHNLWLLLVLFLGINSAVFANNKLYSSVAEAIKAGESLWNDTKLSTNGKKCATCHANGARLKQDDAFPKIIRMAGGVLSLEQMINFCIEKPMAGKAFPANAPELTALSAYHEAMAKRIR